MQNRTARVGLLVLAALLALAHSPLFAASPIPFAEISGALSLSDGAAAQGLADRALVRPGLDAADQARLLGYRGLARNLEGDKEGALADLTRAIDAKNLTESEQSRFYLERGLVLDAMNRLDEASEDYSRALRLDPDSAPALNNRANIFRRLNRFEEARRDYLASLAAGNPAPEYPYYGLGQIAENQGNAEEAKGFYTRAIAANPGYTLAGERLAALGGTAPPQRAIVLIPPARGKAKEAAVPMRSPSRVAAMPSKAVAVIKSADYSSRGARPGLRPALDNSAARGEQVQLGAWRSQAEAAEAWNRAVKIAGSVLSGLAPHIVQVDLPGKGRYYRLRTESVSAGQLCTQLAAKQIDCMPARD